jgi:hypothetical protein
MASKPPVHADSAVQPSSSSLYNTESALGLTLMDILNDDALFNLLSSSLPLGEPWPYEAITGLPTEFDSQDYAPNALDANTQGNGCGHVQPLCSPQLDPSPATSTGSLLSLGIEHSFGKRDISALAVAYPGVVFPSPAAMGLDASLPFLVESPLSAVLTTHEAQGTPEHTVSSGVSPGSGASSLARNSVISPGISARASQVRASSLPAQVAQVRQSPAHTCCSCVLGKSLVSFSRSRSPHVVNGILGSLQVLQSQLLLSSLILLLCILPLYRHLHLLRKPAPVPCYDPCHSRPHS